VALACSGSIAIAAGGTRAERPLPDAVRGPAVNLLVEIRMLDEAQAGGHGSYTVSTQSLAAEAPLALQLQVLNGQAAALRIGQRMPVQWVQAAARGAGLASGSATDSAAAVVQAVTWVNAGQGLWVQPQWPGGEQPVHLALRVDSSTTGPPPAGSTTALPVERSGQVGTRLDVKLGAWTTFAATGPVAAAGPAYTVSTLALSDRGRQLMQVRVSLP
jgi:hypothetical protein